MTDRAPSEQQRTCRGIQGGGSHALVSRHVLQARRSTLDLTGPAREDGRDPQVQRLCEPAPLAPGLGRSRKFSGIRKTHCSFRTQRCPNLSGAEADSEMGVQRGQRPSGGPCAAPGFWEGKDAPRTWWQPPGEREVQMESWKRPSDCIQNPTGRVILTLHGIWPSVGKQRVPERLAQSVNKLCPTLCWSSRGL